MSTQLPIFFLLLHLSAAFLVKVKARGLFMVLINPALINMGTTGYGLAGRRIRDEVISAFHTTYYLRTLPWGAVTRCLVAETFICHVFEFLFFTVNVGRCFVAPAHGGRINPCRSHGKLACCRVRHTVK